MSVYGLVYKPADGVRWGGAVVSDNRPAVTAHPRGSRPLATRQ